MQIRTKYSFSLNNLKEFKQKLLQWTEQFETALWLDSNNYKQKYSSFECCLAVDEFTSIKTDFNNAFDTLKEYQSFTKDYIFGYISYDVKNEDKKLSSNNFDGLHFADLYFFQPQKIITIKDNKIEFNYLKCVDDEINDDFNSISTIILQKNISEKPDINIKPRINKNEYFKKLNKVLSHIQRGDIYEMNFCQEFFAENVTINPIEIYNELNKISEPPFATFLKLENHYLLSASPERYIRKQGEKVISQPIKGTEKRFLNKIDDEKAIINLKNNEKERSENIMIVDLVRNDLSKTAKKGSVKVEELCEVYSFKQVHQLISTITSEVEHTTHPVDIIKNTFPMGSMTGAPKISAMKIIEEIEETKRGLYSGTVGYFTPNGDFDFNVIIRSILYNFDNKYISYSVGGAITAKSNPEKEYEECLIKAEAMKKVLTK